MRRLLLVVVAVCLLSPELVAQTKKPAAKKTTTASASRGITVDTHADTPTEYVENPFDLGIWNAKGHFDYPRMKAGGLDAEFFIAYVPKQYAGNGAAAYCMKMMELAHEMVERYPTWATLADSTTDIRRIAGSGKRAMLIGIEGGHAIEDSLDLLRAFYRFGARYMTLTHTNTNNWADSSGDEKKHGGLTEFGRQVVVEMNRLGMLVDVSHVADETFFDVVAVTKAPVIASHSSARAVADHSRNMSDDMLRAVTKNGGVVMINFFPVYLSTEVAQVHRDREKRLAPAIASLREKYPGEGDEYRKRVKALMDANPLPKIEWTVIVDHIDHIARVAGVNHVGLGSDFDGVSALPVGMEDVSKLPKIEVELEKRGYSASDIRKIMGENFMRVFAEAERIAGTLRGMAPAVRPLSTSP